MQVIHDRNVTDVGGNLAVTGESGANVVLRNHIFSASTKEYMASAGLQSLIGLQTSRWVNLNN